MTWLIMVKLYVKRSCEHALSPVLECERRAQPGVLALVVLVEVQPEGQALQRLVLAARQLQQEGAHHVLKQELLLLKE